MAVTSQDKNITKGAWRTVETFIGANAIAVFRDPRGVQIKVRYGVGWFGFNRQKQTLDGDTDKRLSVSSSGSLARARMQVRSDRDILIIYQLILPGP